MIFPNSWYSLRVLMEVQRIERIEKTLAGTAPLGRDPPRGRVDESGADAPRLDETLISDSGARLASTRRAPGCPTAVAPPKRLQRESGF